MATYYMRAYGRATSKEAATGPASRASACMNVSVHNGETFSSGDTIYISDQGGDYTEELVIPTAGVTYLAVSGESPIFDLSGNAANARGIYINGKANITIGDGVDTITVKGSGGADAVSIYGASTGIICRKLNIPSNHGASSGSHDGYSIGDTSTVTLYNCDVAECRPDPVPGTGSHQAFTTHATSTLTMYDCTGDDSNNLIASVNDSHVTVVRGTFTDGVLSNFATSGTSTITINDADITTGDGKLGRPTDETSEITYNRCAILWDGGTTDNNRGTCTLNDCTMTVTGASAAIGPFTGVYTISGGSITLDVASNIPFITEGATSTGAIQVSDLTVTMNNTKPFYRLGPNFADSYCRNNTFLIDSNPTYAVSAEDSVVNDHNIDHNTFYYTSKQASNEAIDIEAIATGTITCRSNIFINCFNSINGTPTTVSHNCYYNSSDEGGTGSITSDPNLEDAANELFRPIEGSGVIGTGHDGANMGAKDTHIIDPANRPRRNRRALSSLIQAVAND